jgi:ABC-type phosphate/phosphonate transport system ATPase subunit
MLKEDLIQELGVSKETLDSVIRSCGFTDVKNFNAVQINVIKSFLKKISIEDKNYINFLMESFGIMDLKSKLFVELSGGQKQRLILSRNVSHFLGKLLIVSNRLEYSRDFSISFSV